MNDYVLFAIAILCSYILGSISWGVLITKFLGTPNLRTTGSGSTGMTNVMRSAGIIPSIIVLLLDTSKGVLAIALASYLSNSLENISANTFLEMSCGLAALVGHSWSIFLGFHGGKGIATGLGGLLVFSPWLGIAGLASFLPVTLLTKYVSLGSMIGLGVGGGGLFICSMLGIYPVAHGLYGGIGTIIIVFRHKENIKRLLSGTEARLGKKV
ncbi:MAG: acyl-phosphate glycerol 3-phosphate acyltransferase [Chloroflexi bacterium]|nr:acyl-phosphate glycerol 3-phosphate acyltransferase [Chloroflexota bacterium]|tara:strand:- start:2877 stop:3512 length:636 start_codon:yes stop_codon:yes gene_type:complete